jgi:hypothetical protein
MLPTPLKSPKPPPRHHRQEHQPVHLRVALWHRRRRVSVRLHRAERAARAHLLQPPHGCDAPAGGLGPGRALPTTPPAFPRPSTQPQCGVHSPLKSTPTPAPTSIPAPNPMPPPRRGPVQRVPHGAGHPAADAQLHAPAAAHQPLPKVRAPRQLRSRRRRRAGRRRRRGAGLHQLPAGGPGGHWGAGLFGEAFGLLRGRYSKGVVCWGGSSKAWCLARPAGGTGPHPTHTPPPALPTPAPPTGVRGARRRRGRVRAGAADAAGARGAGGRATPGVSIAAWPGPRRRHLPQTPDP